MPTRVSTSQIYENAQTNVAQARSRHSKTSEKAATQKAIVRPSDDPAGWLQAATMKDSESTRSSLNTNAVVATQVLSATELVFGQVQDGLIRAYELAVSQSGTGQGAKIREDVSFEVKELFQNVIQALNYRFGNRTLLGGYHSKGPAFDSSGDFQGDFGKIEVEVDRGQKVPVNVTADRAVFGKGFEGGVNFLNVLKELHEGLANDDSKVIQRTLEPLQAAIDQVSQVRAEIGARQNGLDRVLDRHAQAEVDAASTISQIEDADTIRVFSDLARDQTVLDAAIRTSQKILRDQPGDLLFK